MKFLILPVLFISLSFISCGRKVENIKKRTEKQGRLQFVNDDAVNVNEVNVENIYQKISFNFINRKRSTRTIQPICRGIEGCLSVCKHLQYPKCKQLSVDQVISVWSNQIISYDNWEQAQSDLKLIATKLDVSDFLQIVDEDNQIVQALFNLNTSARCPVNDAEHIRYSYRPSASLYYLENNMQGSDVEIHPESTDGSEAAADAGAAGDAAAKQAEADAGAADAGAADAGAADAGAAGDDVAEQAEADAGAADAGAADAGAAGDDAQAEADAGAADAGAADAGAADAGVADAGAAGDAAQAEADNADCVPKVDFAAIANAPEGQSQIKECPKSSGVQFKIVAGQDQNEDDKSDEAAAVPPETVEPEADDPVEHEAAAAQQMPSRKKIMDGSVIPFNLQVFAGFIKQCFGHNTRTFSEVAAEIENQKAFEIGHQVITKACSGNSECVRLAYCSIDSELVWDQLPDAVIELGCEYDSFTEMLP